MDLNGIEQVETNTLGGADTVTVNDLSGTDVTEADVSAWLVRSAPSRPATAPPTTWSSTRPRLPTR